MALSYKNSEFSRFIEKVRDSADIAVTISRYIPLTLKGKNFWGNCPFHNERTPSFCVNTQQQFYHCFGCGESGNVFNFIMKHENCDFIPALEILAKQNNMTMPEKLGANGDYAKTKKLKDDILAANKIAAKFYYNNLKNEPDETFKSYLWLRGLSDDNIVKKFGIGASLNWDGLVKELRKNNIPMALAKQAGLVDEKNGQIYDFLGERLIFPIINITGDVVGFSGRSLKADAMAKYKNTAETLVFKKGSELFGMNLAKKAFKEIGLKQIILVEGQIDAISLIAVGIDGVVAPLGTAFGEGHIKVLKRWAESVVICFDGDEAGRKATERAFELLKDSGLNVKVIYMPDGSDPDDFVKKNGKDEFIKLLENATSPIAFYLQQAKKKFNLKDSTDLAKFVETAIKVLAEKANEIEAAGHLKELAEISGINPTVIRNKYMADRNKYLETTEGKTTETTGEKKETKKLKAEEEAIVFVLASLMHKKPYAKLDEPLHPEDEILDNWFNFARDSSKKIADYIDEPKNDLIKQAIAYVFKDDKEEEIYYINCLNQIRRKEIDNKIKKLKEKPQTEPVLKEIAELIKQKAAFKGDK